MAQNNEWDKTHTGHPPKRKLRWNDTAWPNLSFFHVLLSSVALSWRTLLPSACPGSPREPSLSLPACHAAPPAACDCSCQESEILPPVLLSHRSQTMPSSPKHPESPMQRRTTWWQRLDSPSAPSPLLTTALQPHSLPASPASTRLQTYLHVENIPWCSCSGSCVPVNLFHVSFLSWWSLFTQLSLVLLSPSHFTSQLGLCKQGNSHLEDLIGIRSVTLSVFFKCVSP